MLLAIPQEKLPIIFAIIGVLLIHYPLALVATSRLFKFKCKGLPDVVWHFIIQLGIIIGPTIFILLHSPKNSKPKVYKRALKVQAEMEAERKAAEQQNSVENTAEENVSEQNQENKKDA